MTDKYVVITRSNPVRPDSRVEKEALTLVKAGYKVKILCWDRDSTHAPEEEMIRIGDKDIPIIRVGFKASFGEGMKNIVPYLRFQFAMRKWIRAHSKDISVLHACDFDTAFFTHRLAKRRKIKVIFDIFDFIGGERKNIRQKILAKAQYGIINNADATIICTEERKDQIIGSKPKKLVVIHNTPAKEQMPGEINVSPRKNDKVRVCYVGILQDGRLLREIGAFFEKNHDIEFHIGGFGYLENYFVELAKANDNIKFYGRIPYEKTLELESNCDIMLAIYDPAVENHRYAAPNKFYESLFLGKPVIMVDRTGMSSIISKEHIGELIEYSEASFARALRNIIARRPDWNTMENNMKRLYADEYSWEIMRNRLLSLYDEITRY